MHELHIRCERSRWEASYCTFSSITSNMSDSLDSLLETALGDSGVRSAQDALVVALHACLLSGGFVCVAVGDEVCLLVVR